MIVLKQGLQPWIPQCPNPFILPDPTLFPKALRLQKSAGFKVYAAFESVDERQLTAREKRQMRNGRRESNPAYNWREEVEERLIKKPKKRYTSWTEELNLDNLALVGPQWWVIRVSRVTGQDTAERLARSLARKFPSMAFKVYAPAVQIKRKLKNGSISVKPKPLFPGCVFLRCVLNKEIHDFIRECDGVGGFVGSKVGNTKRQINKPRPVDAEDMEAIFKQAKEEQETADQAFEDEHKGDGILDSGVVNIGSHFASIVGEGSALVSNLKGRSKKAAKNSAGVPSTRPNFKHLVPGSTVQVVSGSFAGFSGIVKGFDSKQRLVSVGFTLFGKETLADLDVNDIEAPTN